MAPLIDSMNHDGGRALVRLLAALRRLWVRAAADGAAAGSQLFITYGDAKGNDALLQYYGFVEAGNRADRAWRSAALGLDRASGGSEEGLVAVGGVARAARRRRRAPRAMRRRRGGGGGGVAAACAGRLAAMPTTLADDEATLQSGGSALPTRRRLALQWRIEKKRILARGAKG